VIIASADPSKPAHFSSLTLNEVTNVRLVALEISRDRGSEPEYAKLVTIYGGGGIAIEGGSIHGSRDGDPGNDMYGLGATGTAGLTVTGVRIDEVMRGIVADKVTDLTIERSDIDLIRSDAIDIPGSARVRIAGNHISRFRPVPAVRDAAGNILVDGDHPDAVQGWTMSQPSGVADVTIEGNLIEGDPDNRPQGSWFADEANLKAVGKGHRNITIRGNLIISPLWQAMGLADVQGAVVTNNTVINLPGGLPVPGGPVFPWISVAADAQLSGNVAPRYIVAGVLFTPPGNTADGDHPDAIRAAVP
jgi:hypothetical protein